MKINQNVILITGGATGIGLALAHVFVNAGNEVIICGRREAKLQEAKAKLPELHVKACDLTDSKNRQMLFSWVTSNFPSLNVLVNNAGIQNMIDFRQGTRDLLHQESEIAINLDAPINLTALFIPYLLKKEESAIVNITSGLAFTPLAIVPVYCATKAAMHSFSLTLRYQLAGTQIKVFEAILPTTDTELDRGARENRKQKDRGIPPTQVANEIIKGMKEDQVEIIVGAAARLKSEPEKMFNIINR